MYKQIAPHFKVHTVYMVSIKHLNYVPLVYVCLWLLYCVFCNCMQPREARENAPERQDVNLRLQDQLDAEMRQLEELERVK